MVSYFHEKLTNRDIKYHALRRQNTQQADPCSTHGNKTWGTPQEAMKLQRHKAGLGNNVCVDQCFPLHRQKK